MSKFTVEQAWGVLAAVSHTLRFFNETTAADGPPTVDEAVILAAERLDKKLRQAGYFLVELKAGA